MPLFKKLKYEVKDHSVEFRVNVNSSGKFSCKLPHIDIASALGIPEELTSDNYEEIQRTISKAVIAFNELNTQHVYTIHYKFHISNRIKRQMPEDLMTSEMWKKTNPYGSSNQYYKDDIAIDINWYPCVESTLGKTKVLYKLRVAEQEDINRMIENPVYYSLFTGREHKPYSELIFLESDRIFNFYNEPNFFSIPLTAESYDFFQGIEGSFVGLITKMISFLSQDPDKLMEAISIITLQKGNLLLDN